MAEYSEGLAGELPDEEDEEDYEDSPEASDTASDADDSAEEVSSPAPSAPEQVPPPAPVAAPSFDDSKFASLSDRLDTTNAQVQQVLQRLERPVQAPQDYSAPTGAYGYQEQDPYFITKEEVIAAMKPMVDQINSLKQIEFANREDRLVKEFAASEARFRERYGDRFDKYVSSELRDKALQSARQAVREGRQKDSDIKWDHLFDVEFRHNAMPDLERELAERQKADALIQEQQAELKKVSAMPKGGNRHQAPAVPARRTGESPWDAMRRGVISALKRA